MAIDMEAHSHIIYQAIIHTFEFSHIPIPKFGSYLELHLDFSIASLVPYKDKETIMAYLTLLSQEASTA